MKTYDYIIRVSKMGSRREDDESTMTVDDQRLRCVGAIQEQGARVGQEHKVLDPSGTASVDSKLPPGGPPARAARRVARHRGPGDAGC
jgi:hypothetical protein